VKQGELQVRTVGPAVGDDGPEAGEAEGELAGDRQDLTGEGAFFGEFEEAEEEKGFMRGGASGAVDFEVGEFGEVGMGVSLSISANFGKDWPNALLVGPRQNPPGTRSS